MWTDLKHGAWQNLSIVAQPLNLWRRFASKRAFEYNAATFCDGRVLKRFDELRLAYSCTLCTFSIIIIIIIILYFLNPRKNEGGKN